MSNRFNYYFTKIGEKLAAEITKINSYQIENKQVYPETMFMYPTNINEIKTVINNLKNKKTSGVYGITAELLKSVQEEISVPLTFIMI